LTGKEGYGRVVRSFQNLVEWVLRVAVLEFGARVTFWILRLLQTPSEMGGLTAASIHLWIGSIGMFGWVISELLYEVGCLVGQIAGIRALWRKLCGSRKHRW